MQHVGIITFHRVYNYGAVIQAYAMQCCLSKMGYDAEIIDFSRKIQLDYTNIISIRHGLKRFIKGLMMISVLKQRIARKSRFDYFIKNKMKLTMEKYDDERNLYHLDKIYDAFVCGSDQIWNPLKKSDFNQAYLLDFTKKRKIAYAPSIGSASYDDLKPYKESLKDFYALSCRESGGADIISRLTSMPVEVVLDPTLLVDKDKLIELTEKTNEKPYLLYYTLDGNDNKNRNLDILKAFSEKFKLDIKIISPEWPYHKKPFIDIVDAGPLEFLTLIRNATMVCTNSFHGTALSIKFERPFYVLEEKGIKDERKRSLLIQLGLVDRLISSEDKVHELSDYRIDYSVVGNKLEIIRKKSQEYLEDALRGI